MPNSPAVPPANPNAPQGNAPAFPPPPPIDPATRAIAAIRSQGVGALDVLDATDADASTLDALAGAQGYRLVQTTRATLDDYRATSSRLDVLRFALTTAPAVEVETFNRFYAGAAVLGETPGGRRPAHDLYVA